MNELIVADPQTGNNTPATPSWDPPHQFNQLIEPWILDRATYEQACGFLNVAAASDAEIAANAYALEYAEFENHGNMWQQMGRDRRVRFILDTHRLRGINEERAAARPAISENLVLCDCGHMVLPFQRMMASRGTACPACYDRMSD